ncbi:Fe-S cluster assembly sulfur transfer protein SufU [Murdochiella vaginalis]|uniref:Fe-S cluster assembly sulfur transfer protein SufU n=1 Tax=Murdochiella vaginalis TaxID=1852373 RepID=UPI0008FE0B4E|nr:SUF system NifU family Fe-S cluster assembly protein [Murdochiella vaginalis]
MDMKQIYTQIVMEHARQSAHRHELADATDSERGHNPSCGDDITLHIKREGDRIEELSFTGHGCAISQASTSLLCELLEGKSVEEAKQAIEAFLAMIKGEEQDDDVLEEQLGDAVALKDISHMPQRVKCAVLAWRTLNDMLEKENEEK